MLYVNVCFVFLLIHTFAKDIAHKHKKKVLKTINICNMHAITFLTFIQYNEWTINVIFNPLFLQKKKRQTIFILSNQKKNFNSKFGLMWV